MVTFPIYLLRLYKIKINIYVKNEKKKKNLSKNVTSKLFIKYVKTKY